MCVLTSFSPVFCLHFHSTCVGAGLCALVTPDFSFCWWRFVASVTLYKEPTRNAEGVPVTLVLNNPLVPELNVECEVQKTGIRITGFKFFTHALKRKNVSRCFLQI